VYYSEIGEPAKAAPFEARYALAAPDDRAAILHAMTLYLEAKQTQSAVDLAHRFPGWEQRPDLRNLLGKAYGAMKQYDRCAAELREAVRLNPNSATYQSQLGYALMGIQSWTEAAAAYEQAAKLSPEDARVWAQLCVAYSHSGALDRAIEAGRTAIKLDPQLPQGYNDLGVALDGKDALDDAADAFRQAVRLTWGKPSMLVPAVRELALTPIKAQLEPRDGELFFVACGLRPGVGSMVDQALARSGDTFTYMNAVPKRAALRMPIVFVHGRGDEVIPWYESERAREALAPGHPHRVYYTGMYAHTLAKRPSVRQAGSELATFVAIARTIAMAPTGRLAWPR